MFLIEDFAPAPKIAFHLELFAVALEIRFRQLEEMMAMLTRRHHPVEPRLREVHGELNCTRNRLRQVELEAQQHKAQLSLLTVGLGTNEVE